MFKFEFFKRKLKPQLKDLPAQSTFILISEQESPFPEVFQKMSVTAEVNGISRCNVYTFTKSLPLWLDPETEVVPVDIFTQVNFEERK